MYLDTKAKLIPLVILAKFILKIFHSRIYHLVVTLNISVTSDGSRAVYAAAYAVRPTAPRRAAW